MIRGQSNAIANRIRLKKARLVLAALIVGAICFSQFSRGSPQSGKESTIKLIKPDGREVLVPLSGPLSNDTAQAVARDIQSFDKEAKSRRHPVDAKNEEVAAAMMELAVESRNDALEQLDLAYRITQKSAGTLDNRLLNGAKRDIDSASQILLTSPPPSVQVHTRISSTIPNATLHYCGVGDYKENGNGCAWESYSSGAVLHIGRYMFRMDIPGTQSRPYTERVLVLNDPTERTLSPMP